MAIAHSGECYGPAGWHNRAPTDSARDLIPPSSSQPPWRWWPFLFVVAAYAVVALQQITLPGVYMDAVNPDYIAIGLLHSRGEVNVLWLMPGNWAWNRAPLLVVFHHLSQQMWLGLSFVWLFGTL